MAVEHVDADGPAAVVVEFDRNYKGTVASNCSAVNLYLVPQTVAFEADWLAPEFVGSIHFVAGNDLCDAVAPDIAEIVDGGTAVDGGAADTVVAAAACLN